MALTAPKPRIAAHGRAERLLARTGLAAALEERAAGTPRLDGPGDCCAVALAAHGEVEEGHPELVAFRLRKLFSNHGSRLSAQQR